MSASRHRLDALSQEAATTDRGFTVIEALVSFVLLALVGASATSAIVATMRTSNTTRDRVTAANIAQQDIQDARSLRYPNYPAGVAAHTVTVGNKSFTVSRSVTTPCPATWIPDSPPMQVVTTVTWRDGKTPVTIGTEIAC